MNSTAMRDHDAGIRREADAPVSSDIANLSHELANPINAIALTTELAKRLLARGQTAQAAEALDAIAADCDRCTRLLRDAQDYLALEIHPVHEKIDLTAMLEDIARPLRARGEIAIAAPTEDCRVEGDVQALRRLFREVLRNAFDHGARRVEVALRCDAHAVHVRIGDDGPGIDPAQRTRVFEAFFSTQRQQHSGTGLSLARLIARAHEGDIEVESAEQGTVFRVTLPA